LVQGSWRRLESAPQLGSHSANPSDGRKPPRLVPLGEIPLADRHAQFRLAVQVEFDQGVAHVGFDRFGRDAQAGRHLAVGVVAAGEGGHFLLARRERLPALNQVGVRLALGEGGGEQVGVEFLQRAVFFFSKLEQGGAQGGLQPEGGFGGREVQPQSGKQVLEGLQHQVDYIEHMFFRQEGG
jgi:hypothetical protein